MKTKQQLSWDIYLDGIWQDTVFFNADCDEEYVKSSLIDHDGLNSDIKVVMVVS